MDTTRAIETGDERRSKELAEHRQRYLGCIRILSGILIFLGIISLGVGAAAVLKTKPYYYFPFASGMGVVQGVFCVISGLMGLCIVSEGRKTPSHPLANTTRGLRCAIGFSHCVGGFTLVGILLALGMSGAWAVAECNRDPSKAALSRDRIDRCLPDKQANLALAGVIIALASMLFICFLILWCILICNSRSFGEKPRGYIYQEERIGDLEAECNELRETSRRDDNGRVSETGRDYSSGRDRDRGDRDRRSRGRDDRDRRGPRGGYYDRYHYPLTEGDRNRDKIADLEDQRDELKDASRKDADNRSRGAGRDYLSDGGRDRDYRDRRDRSPRGYNRDSSPGDRRRDHSPRDHHRGCDTEEHEHGHYSNQNRYGHGRGRYDHERDDRGRGGRGGERDRERPHPRPSAPPDPSGDEKSAPDTDAPPSYSDVMSHKL